MSRFYVMGSVQAIIVREFDEIRRFEDYETSCEKIFTQILVTHLIHNEKSLSLRFNISIAVFNSEFESATGFQAALRR